MKKIILLFGIILLATNLYAADTEISDLSADATPGTDSLVVTIDDPSGTPVSRKSTIGQVLSARNDIDSNGDVTITEAPKKEVSGLVLGKGTRITLTKNLIPHV